MNKIHSTQDFSLTLNVKLQSNMVLKCEEKALFLFLNTKYTSTQR